MNYISSKIEEKNILKEMPKKRKMQKSRKKKKNAVFLAVLYIFNVLSIP